MTESLIAAAEPDGFTHESPIRAFTEFRVAQCYAIGKGFRPSLGHLHTYLDAMERKEGWCLVQLIDGGTLDPTLIFHKAPRASAADCTAVPLMPEMVPEAWAKSHSDVPIPYERIPDLLSHVAKDLRVEEETLVLEYSRTGEDLSAAARLIRCPILHDKSAVAVKRSVDGFRVANSGRRVAMYAADGERVGSKRAAPDHGAPHDVPLLILVRSNFGKDHECSGIYTDGRWFIVTRMLAQEIGQKEPLRGVPLAWRKPGSEPWTFTEISMPVDYSGPIGPITATLDAMARNGGVEPEDQDDAYGTTDVLASMIGADQAAIARADDPINPKHYNGTACAEIGELLTANSYQVLKYNWRLGEKDAATIELGKALWYLDREIALFRAGQHRCPGHALPDHGFFDVRLKTATDHAKAVARVLISWNRYGNLHSLTGLRKSLQRQLDGLTDNDLPEGLKV